MIYLKFLINMDVERSLKLVEIKSCKLLSTLLFLTNSKWVVGKGNKVRFWKDTWCGTENFQARFPLIFAIEGIKISLLMKLLVLTVPRIGMWW